ncbi:MAG TPA: FHA domain-containing protein [Gemmatimonadaceae bacterium]|jgi:pSer/pThr/pTyr-binding forkhead associated (FHA) protein|nr:FHA domain-containing protein [Gemmatimonadaceae bacterium]
MPYLQLNERQFALRVGETRVGGGAEADVLVPGGDTSVQAVVDLSRESAVSIRRAFASAAVRVNGVQLGAEPTPLIHGDKIEIGGAELFFGDDRKGGSTQFISSVSLPDFQKLKPPAPGKATLATGGRVISLVDGREYQIPAAGISFGRDAGCDVVIPSSEVSRRHAEIAPGDVGYVLSDTSTNGIFVNGQRVDAMQVLGRGDVVRIGTEEFRFYADQASASPKVEVPAADPAAASAPTPAVAAPFPRQALATLEVVGTSPMKGQTFSIVSVLAHVGRGPHNDIVIVEESVSDSHAKLQRREGTWYVTDLGSTNGTYIGGRRIAAEEKLATDADIRFGGVPLVFRSLVTEHVTEPKGGTRQLSIDAVKRAAPAAPVAAPAPRPRPAAPPPAPKRAGVPWWAWLVVIIVVGGAAFFAMRMR